MGEGGYGGGGEGGMEEGGYGGGGVWGRGGYEGVGKVWHGVEKGEIIFG